MYTLYVDVISFLMVTLRILLTDINYVSQFCYTDYILKHALACLNTMLQ
jgi:hypothetical protein